MKPILTKKNYTWITIGFVTIILGFLLMSGGGSERPEDFNPEIFSFRRIRIAPTVVVVGFLLIARGIMLKPRQSEK